MENKIVKPNLFLIELMISVLFFALCSAVCLSLFAKAHLLSVESSDMTHALNMATQAAECIKSNPKELRYLLMGNQESENLYRIYYDSDWNLIADREGMKYEMIVEINRESPVMKAKITVQKQDAQIYEIEVKKYNG